jgi:CheY-like chemotaxis protein/glycine cleavage system H lipoate-binding protein
MKDHKNILIVDDEEVVINSVIKIASLEGFSIEGVNDAFTAFEKIDETDFDLIISDIMMPKTDGFKFLAELESKRISTPLIMTTGYTTIENAVQSLYHGAIDFIPKPFTVDEMISVLNRGIRYSALKKAQNSGSAILVPGPAKYFRLGYSSWMNKEPDGSVMVGATDLFVKTLGQVKNVEMYFPNGILIQASPGIKIIAEDGLIHQLFSPLSGTIIDRNENLIVDPTLLEKDPYFEGWIYRIIPTEFDYEMKLLIPCSSDRR